MTPSKAFLWAPAQMRKGQHGTPPPLSPTVFLKNCLRNMWKRKNCYISQGGIYCSCILRGVKVPTGPNTGTVSSHQHFQCSFPRPLTLLPQAWTKFYFQLQEEANTKDSQSLPAELLRGSCNRGLLE